jgi:hypothetical protein
MNFNLEFLGGEMKVPRLPKIKLTVRGLILGSPPYASFFGMLLLYDKNPSLQVEQKSYRSYRRIDSSKLIYRLTIHTI